MTLLEHFESYTIENIPRKDNRHANAMASVTSLVSLKDSSTYFTFTVHTLTKPSIDETMKEVLVTNIEVSSEWYSLIFNYLKEGTFPKSTTKNTRTRI